MISIKSHHKSLPLLLFSWLLCLLMLFIIVISLDKGFDFTDEGYFLLDYKYVDIYRGGVHNYHLIITKLTDWLNPTILGYRWMSLGLTILSSFILSIGLHKWLDTNYSNNANTLNRGFSFVLSFISIGNFLYYFGGFQTIHNNTLTNFFIQVATGLVLYLISSDPGVFIKSKLNMILIWTTGIICGFLFFVKFPTAISLFFLIVVVFITYLRKQSYKYLLYFTLLLTSGAVCGICLYFLFVQDYHEWVVNFENAYFMLSDHSPTMLLKNYLKSLSDLVKFSVVYFSWLIVIPIFVVFKKYFLTTFSPEKVRNIIVIFLSLCIILFTYEIIHFKFYRSVFATNRPINAYFYIIIISFQTVLLLVFSLRAKLSRVTLESFYNKILIMAYLFIVPFLGSFGTANPLFLNVLIHLAPWFAIIIFLTIELSDYIKNHVVQAIFIIIPALVTTSQVIDGNIYTPYYTSFRNLNHAAYFDQTQSADELPLLAGVKIDKDSKKFLLELKILLDNNNFKAGYPIFGFHLAGVVYALGGTSPGMPYYFNILKRDCIAMARFELRNNPPIIMLTDNNPINEELLSCMKEKGIIYPENYELRGEVYFPNVGGMLKVYFPKSK